MMCKTVEILKKAGINKLSNVIELLQEVDKFS
jgi:hypothetical protein